MGWFNKRTPASGDDIRALQLEVRQLRDDLDLLQAHHMRLRGRVYAIHGKLPTEATESASTPTNPADPALTKAQARALLLAQGRLTPTKN